MENSWHENVLRWGLGDEFITVCSPMLGIFPSNWILTNRYDPFGASIWVYPPDTNPDLPYGVQTRPKLTPHFPYGYPVVPP